MIWWSLLLSILYSALLEYWFHRWLFHRNLIGCFYRAHTIEHHGKHRNDVNIDQPILPTMLAAAPLILAALPAGPPAVAPVVVVAICYSKVWTWLHRAHHDIPQAAWVKRLPFYSRFRKHHLTHHRQPKTNFAGVFLFTDYLLGTKA